MCESEFPQLETNSGLIHFLSPQKNKTFCLLGSAKDCTVLWGPGQTCMPIYCKSAPNKSFHQEPVFFIFLGFKFNTFLNNQIAKNHVICSNRREIIRQVALLERDLLQQMSPALVSQLEPKQTAFQVECGAKVSPAKRPPILFCFCASSFFPPWSCEPFPCTDKKDAGKSLGRL